VEPDDRPVVATFLMEGDPFLPGTSVSLGDEVARHVRVRRLGVGTRLALIDGQGHRATGTLVRTSPTTMVEIESLAVTSPPLPVHLLVPIADKDRMMWLAEKVAELGATSWRPVLYRRSRSVKPRGEGQMFNGRVRARMASALEQSGGLWMPALYPEANLSRAVAALPSDGARLVLDRDAPALVACDLSAPVSVALGPEGGIEDDEMAELERAGFRRVSLSASTLRFETAGVAALAVIAARLMEAQPS
jgi:16S rRNA (uracil1498-N3)-methyltransferase